MSRRNDIDWAAIAVRFADRSVSVREIARDHGICEAAIRKWAKRNHIERDRRETGTSTKDRRALLRANPYFIPDNEAGACAVLRTLLNAGELASTWDLPPIVEWREEFSFGRGRVDFLLIHADQSASLVEVKNVGSDREVLGGIGQLHLYASQSKRTFEAKGYHTVRKILCVATKQQGSRHLVEACKSADVILEFIGTVKDHQEYAIKALAELLGIDHGQQ